MKYFSLCLVLLVAQPIFAQNGVKVKRLDSYSLSFNVSTKGLKVNAQHGKIHKGRVEIERSSKIRSGCSIKTPWLKTVGANMSLAVYPKFTVKWAGTLGPDAGSEEDLLEVRIYTKSPDTDESLHKRYYMHTGDLRLQWMRIEQYGDTYYRGEHANSFSSEEQAMSSKDVISFGATGVEGFGEFQVAICNIQPSTSVELDSIMVIADFEEE